jgi:hypothetical protein
LNHLTTPDSRIPSVSFLSDWGLAANKKNRKGHGRTLTAASIQIT